MQFRTVDAKHHAAVSVELKHVAREREAVSIMFASYVIATNFFLAFYQLIICDK